MYRIEMREIEKEQERQFLSRVVVTCIHDLTWMLWGFERLQWRSRKVSKMVRVALLVHFGGKRK